MKKEFLIDKQNERIEKALNSEASVHIQGLVKEVLDEEPSLSWRSQLNDRLRHTAQKKASRRRWLFVVSPSLGLAVAGVLAVTLMFNSHKAVSSPGNLTPQTQVKLAASLFATHADNEVENDVAGSSLSVQESTTDSDADPDQGS